jgi:RHH-type transcriptional regulator, rel operon repressor / antitoxin RelB
MSVPVDKHIGLTKWQVAGVKKAITSLDRGEGVPHEEVAAWVNSWGRKRELPISKRSTT